MKTEKKIKILDFKLTKSIWNSLFWFYRSKFYWSWIDFAEHREYNYWDSIKNIDWKASSKTEKIYTKRFEEERDLKVLFLLDLRESMFFWFWEKTKKDLLEEVFYAISFSCYKNNDSIWAYLFTEKNTKFFPYRKNIWNIFQVLKEIDELKSPIKSFFNKENNLKNILELVRKANTKNNLIFILTDDLDLESIRKNLKSLALQNEIVFINIFDFFENNLEKIDSNLIFENAWKFLEISLKNEEKIKKYSKKRMIKLKKFRDIMMNLGILNIYLDTKKDAFKELYLAFNR